MVTGFQFETAIQLIDSGITSYVQIRQQVGLTSDELDDIINNREFYTRKFAVQDKIEEQKQSKKKPWWKRQ
jgi:hypothetical protein